MADTARTLAALQTLLADNGAGGISAQDLRDMLVSVHQEAFDIYNVRSYGAVGDGVADDTSAINSAIGAANSADGELFIPPGTYKITSNLTAINCSVNASPGAQINVTSPATIGMTIDASRQGRTARLPRLRQTSQVWSGSGPTYGSDIGLLVKHADSWIFEVPHIGYFTEGLYCNPTTAVAVAYNTFTLGILENNARNVHLRPQTNGWVNQNVFIGGRYHVNSNEGPGPITDCFMIWLDGRDYTFPMNKNTFINPSVESDVVEAMIHLQGKVYYSEFFSYRAEGTATPILIDSETSGDIRFNSFFGGYGFSTPMTKTGSGINRQNYFWSVEHFVPPHASSTLPGTGVEGALGIELGTNLIKMYESGAWRTLTAGGSNVTWT